MAIHAITSRHAQREHLRFGTHSSRIETDWLDARTREFETGLEALQAKDTQENPCNPVILRLKIGKIVSQVHQFLKQRLQTPIDQPLPFMIGVAGGTASGKSTVTEHWTRLFIRQVGKLIGWKNREQGPFAQALNLDHYFFDYAKARREKGDTAFFRDHAIIDTPDGLDMPLATQHVFKLKNGQAVRTPQYEFTDSSRKDAHQLKVPTPVILVEGLYALRPEPLAKLFNLKVFVQATEPVRSERWWDRAASRNLSGEAARIMHDRAMAKHSEFVEPTASKADLVLNGNAGIANTQKFLAQLNTLLIKVLTAALPTKASA
ncbi:MAG: hypothetical protein K2X01_00600 [Cyanobacteria bacterium]|nr:hypothetical protein [Cyanobacteriota bacterium]